MFHYALGWIGTLVLCGCGPTMPQANASIPPPFTTDDPSGVFPESPTTNLHGGEHRSFILEKREFIQGEPIIVEFRTWPRDKPETFQNIGGSDRLHGRDNTFVFLMRASSGVWLEAAQPGTDHGGLIAGVRATKERPIQLYNAVQRWCVINAPGEYDLYCFYRENVTSADSETSAVDPVGASAPVTPYLPEAVQAWRHDINSKSFEEIKSSVPAGELESAIARWDALRAMASLVGDAHDFAQFKISIRSGDEAEQQALVNAWLSLIEEVRASSGTVDSHVRNRLSALLEGVYFEQHRCWLPTLAAWEGDGTPEYLNGMYVGLLLNPHIEAIRVALGYPDDALTYWKCAAPPGLAAQLKRIADSDPDSDLRARAATWLSKIAPYGPAM